MSLLLKALKQAERQNREASVPAEALDIDLPAKSAKPAAATPPLTLTPANQEDPPEPFPSLPPADPEPESSLAFAEEDSAAPAPKQALQEPLAEAFPRHAPPQPSIEPPATETAPSGEHPARVAEKELAATSPAPYLRASEAGLVLGAAPNKKMRLLALTIVGAAIGVAIWWAVFDDPLMQPPLTRPILAGTPLALSNTPAAQPAQIPSADPKTKAKPSETPAKEAPGQPDQSNGKSVSAAAVSKSAPAQRAAIAQPVRATEKPPATASDEVQPALPPVRFVRAARPGKSRQTLLSEGYRSLIEGDYSQARTAYQTALKQDRNLIDGWVGLASVAAHEGNRSLAIEHYQRALNLDPSDAAARSGLIAMRGSHQGQEGESALRSLLSTTENNPTALLALANRLATQGRWREAQQAYFKANSVQPDRPDTLFNLAVSLEQIRQPAAAIRFYERALKLTQSRPYQFDQAIAEARIKALRPAGDS